MSDETEFTPDPDRPGMEAKITAGDTARCFTGTDGKVFFGFTRVDGTETPL